MSPNSTEQVKKIVTYHLLQVCMAAFLSAVGRGLIPQRGGVRVGAVQGAAPGWEHGRRMLQLVCRVMCTIQSKGKFAGVFLSYSLLLRKYILLHVRYPRPCARN